MNIIITELSEQKPSRESTAKTLKIEKKKKKGPKIGKAQNVEENLCLIITEHTIEDPRTSVGETRINPSTMNTCLSPQILNRLHETTQISDRWDVNNQRGCRESNREE